MSFYNSLLEKISFIEKQIKDRELRDANIPWYISSAHGSNEGKENLPWFVVAEELPEKIKLRFWKIILYFVRIWMIIRGAPTSNFNIFTQAGKEGVYICNYSFCYYKGFHRNTKWKFITALIAATTAVSLIVALVFPGKPRAMAAEITWNQTNWSGGADPSAYASHAANQSNWTKYYSKMDNVNVIAGAITESTANGDTYYLQTTSSVETDSSVGYTTTSGFNKVGSDIPSNVYVSGTGDNANLMVCDYSLSTSAKCQGGSALVAGGSWNAGTSKCDWTPPADSTIGGVYCGIGVFTVPTGTVNVAAYDSGTGIGGRLVVYADSATITGALSASGKGYTGGAAGADGNTCSSCDGNGKYSANYAGGGGYGGVGGRGTSAGSTGGSSYGSITIPNELGSGGAYYNGGSGGAGGGLIKLNIVGTLTVESSGSIVSNGNSGSGNAGGGSGGAINMTAGGLAGTGLVSANGGNGSNSGEGAGGGGRIAVYYTGAAFSGTFQAYGGVTTGYQKGGAGTIYQKASGNGDLNVNNNNVSGAVTSIVDTSNTFDNLTIQGAANLNIPSGKTVTTGILSLKTNGDFTTSVNTTPAPDVADSSLVVTGSYSLEQDLSVGAARNLQFGPSASLNIPSEKTLTHSANTTFAAGKVNYISWTLGTLTVDGSINVNGKGYSAGNGIAGSIGGTMAGAGHGGAGGNSSSPHTGGATSGDTVTGPTQIGSAAFSNAYSGAGGGYVKIIADTVTISGTGAISANGSNGSLYTGNIYGYGGGAGGSIWLNITSSLLGTGGSITANGGNGPVGTNVTGGGGGGGVIAVYYSTETSTISITATGGTGYSTGGGYGSVHVNGVTDSDGVYTTSLNNFNSKFASENKFNNLAIKQSIVLNNGERSLSNTVMISGKLRDSLSPSLPEMTEKIKFFFSNLFSHAKNIFDLAFGVPTAQAAITEIYTSASFDTTFALDTYDVISWSSDTLPSGITLKFQMAFNNDNATWNFGGSDGSGASYYTTSGGSIDPGVIFSNNRYFKFKVFIDNAGVFLPDRVVLNGVTISYNSAGFPLPAQELISTPYRAYDAAKGGDINVLSSVAWDEGMPQFTAHISSGAVTSIDVDNAGYGLVPDTEFSIVIAGGGGIEAAAKAIVNSGGVVTSVRVDNGGSGYTTVPSVSVLEKAEFQIRTAPDNGGVPGVWSDWCGRNDGIAGSCNSTMSYAFTDSSGGEQIDDIQRDGYNDEWIQYKIYLSSGGAEPATVSEVRLKYILNTIPAVTAVSASQGADGAVTVGYSLSDADALITDTINVSIFADIDINLNDSLNHSSGHTGGIITVSGANALLLPSSGTIQIGNEQIYYPVRSGYDLGSVAEPAVRAYNGTKYAEHVSGVDVWVKGVNITSTGDTVSAGAIALTGITSTPVAKTASWNIAADLPGIYSGTAKIMVSVNDGQIGNPIGTGSVSNVVLDTVAPASLSLKIDPNTAGDTLTNISATESSTPLSIKFVNSSSINGSTCAADIASANPAYQVLSGTSANLSLSAFSGGVYAVCYKIKDARGNESAVVSAVTPVIPVNIKAGDTSYGALFKYRNLVWWTLSNSATTYKIKRCEIVSGGESTYCDTDTGTNYIDFATIGSSSQNYCFDRDQTNTFPISENRCALDTIAEVGPIGLTNTSKYCYRVLAENSTGASAYSVKTDNSCSQPTGDLTGKGSGVPPQPIVQSGPYHNLSAVDGATLNTYTTASITWTTDIASYSLVKYSTASDLSGSSTAGTIVNQTTMEGTTYSHTVELINLEPGTVYYYQAISGVAGSASSINIPVTKSFTTKAPLSINELADNPGQTFANITWTTDAPATSVVYYAAGTVSEANLLLTTPITNTEKVTNHNILISSLTPLTGYSYLVKSFYGPGVGSSGSLISAVSSFTTLTDAAADIVAPVISDVACDGNLAPAAACTPVGTSATITWTTTDADLGNANSYSIVEYNIGSVVSANSLTAGSLIVNATPASPVLHTVVLTGLIPNTEYAYRVHSGDAFGNLATSGAYTFGANSAPVISEVTPLSFDRSTAVISWTTDKPSYSQLEYSASSANSANVGSAAVLLSPHANSPTSETTVKVTQHAIALDNLDQATDYYFRAVSNDGSAIAKSNINSFKTTGGAVPTITYSPTDVIAETTAQITFQSSADAFISVMYTTDAVTTASADSSYSKASSLMAEANTNATVVLSGLTANTVYNYRLVARDIYGNIGRENQIRTFTTARDIIAPSITLIPATDVSVTSTSATITWKTCNAGDVICEAANATVNYGLTNSYGQNQTNAKYNINQSITLNGLLPSTTYYFKAISADAAGNSCLADPTDICPVGSFTTLPEPPTITDIKCNGAAVTENGACNPDPTDTSAVITWTTNQKSSSLVDFGISLSYGSTQGNSTALETAHTVTLRGLIANKKYYFRVKSGNASGDTLADDNSGQGYSFNTPVVNSLLSASTGLAIGSVSVVPSSTTATSAVISWTTASFITDGVIGYSADNGAAVPAYNFETSDLTPTASHKVTLFGLTPNTKYFFKVKSRSRNESASAPSSGNEEAQKETYSFTTLDGADLVPPIISDISHPIPVTANTAVITWTSDEATANYVDYGLESGGIYNLSQGLATVSAAGSRSVTLRGLTAETTYMFRVRSQDASGNQSTLIDSTGFETTAGSDVVCAITPCRICPVQEVLSCPVIDLTAPIITDIKISGISFNTAIITWTTDELSNSMVAYDVFSFDTKGKFAYSSGNSEDSTKSHSVTLNNLDSANTYYFRVFSTDAKGNIAKSADQSFKTPAISESADKGAATAETLKKEFESIAKTLVKDNLATEENIKDIISRITNPPVIGSDGPVVKDIRSYGATIIWQTDRKANSIVKFTSEENTGSLSKLINWKEIGMTNIFETDHKVVLLGLVPSTSYSYQAQSQDLLGNTSTSEIKTFITSGASSIYNVLVSDLNLTSAKITWETANISTSSLEYGSTAAYGNYIDNGDEKVKLHSISLTNLAPDSIFHFRVRSTEELGTILVSDDYSFSTPALPQITKYELGEVKDNSISLSWTSNIPIDSNVRYTDTETNAVKNIGKEEKNTDHNLLIEGLEAGKSYKIEIQGRDDANNLAFIPSFDVQTGMDTISPEITQVRSQSAVLSTAEDKVQSIISWRTNELSSTKVLWDLGGTKGDTLANETVLDANLTTNHIIVLTQFKPGTVYRFRVVSADKFGNTTSSADYTVLAPVKRQSIIQMIINQFENIFGWTKGIGI